MVIVNEDKHDWKADLNALNCLSCIFQVYHDFHGNALYRLNGEHPFIRIDFCHCRYQKGLPYVVEVLDKHFLDSHGILNGSTFNVEYKEKNFQWSRQDDSGRVFLNCSNPRPPLDPMSDRYRLNYNQGLFRIPPNKGFFSKLLNSIGFNKAFRNSFKTFSFTKD
jgi:hypothetical protein